MAQCPYCGFHRGREEGQCRECAHLDFSYLDEADLPVAPEDIRWADDGGYVLETSASWSEWAYIAVEDPEKPLPGEDEPPVHEDGGLLAAVRNLFE